VSDDDLVVADEDFLDEKSQDPLALRHIEDVRRGPQSREERRQRFSEAQIGCAIDGLVDDRLQLGVVGLLAPPQSRHALAQFIQR